MFELEIMATGYAIVVSTVTMLVCKFLSRKKLSRLREKLNRAKTSLSNAEAEINQLKIALGEKTTNTSG